MAKVAVVLQPVLRMPHLPKGAGTATGLLGLPVSTAKLCAQRVGCGPSSPCTGEPCRSPERSLGVGTLASRASWKLRAPVCQGHR